MPAWPSSAPEGGRTRAREAQRRIEEYAVECSILKVYGSEMLTLVADELVATMGGYGYVEEYPAERYYRDARINRIFEGTNEINRLIITGWMMKRAMSGKLPLLPAIKKLMDEVTEPPSFDDGDRWGRAAGARGRGVVVGEKDRAVCRRRGQPAVHDPPPGAAGSDGGPGRYHQPGLCFGVGAAAGAQAGSSRPQIGRSGRCDDRPAGRRNHGLAEQAARRVLAACAEGDLLRTQLAILRRLARFTPADAVGLSRTVAKHAIARERYPV